MRYVYVTAPFSFIQIKGVSDQYAITLDEAREWLKGEWQSAVCDPELAEALTSLTGVKIPVATSKEPVVLSPGDEALIFRTWVFSERRRMDNFVDIYLIKMGGNEL